MSRDPRKPRTEPAAEWRSPLTIATAGSLLFLTVTGLIVLLMPFGHIPQSSLLLHTLVGLVGLPAVLSYAWIHWRKRRGGNLSHYQLLGYMAVSLTLLCVLTGLVVTAQALFGQAVTDLWDLAHLATGLALPALLAAHLVTILVRPTGSREAQRIPLLNARRRFWIGSGGMTALLLITAVGWASLQPRGSMTTSFPDDYNWRFGEDRPFAPSLARVDQGGLLEGLDEHIGELLAEPERTAYLAALASIGEESAGTQHYAGPQTGPLAQRRRALERAGVHGAELEQARDRIEEVAAAIRRSGALDEQAMAGSERCGDCHAQIYEEWLPSAHRYAAMDDLFQQVQTLMAEETSPEHTRYCAGCHDPISLFSGAKNSGNLTLSATGFEEGISCVSCHSIAQADIQGNADYTIRLSRPYQFENATGETARLASDFLIRAYPQHHVESYSRPLYKTPEYCAACHKQYMDVDLNTDIGRVQGQNQYDSWARSRWHDEDDPDKTLHCRECHMRLKDSSDPAAGDGHDNYRRPDDGKHRSHRFLGGNQYLPLLHELEGAQEHVELTEQWLRGEIEIPEIADRWTDGPVVRMAIEAPETIERGAEASFQVVLTNNKTGHDFPTGPLDMLESWLEVRVVDDLGRVIYHSGALDESGRISDPVVWFKADGFDREGELIDRHNLWDLVGKSYARSIFPGMNDRVELPLECPSVAMRRIAAEVSEKGDTEPPDDGDRHVEALTLTLPQDDARKASELRIEAVLWYRKVNADFMDRIYGAEAGMRSPVTEINRQTRVVTIREH